MFTRGISVKTRDMINSTPERNSSYSNYFKRGNYPVNDPRKVVTIYFPGYYLEFKEGDPQIPHERKQAKIARFFEAILSMSSVGSMADAAKEIFGHDSSSKITLPPEVESVLTSWLEVSDNESLKSLSNVKELLGETPAYQTKLRNIAWKAEEIKNHPVLNSPQKKYLESIGLDSALIRSPTFLKTASEKNLNQLIARLNR